MPWEWEMARIMGLKRDEKWFWRASPSETQNRKRGAAVALSSGTMLVSNSDSVSHESSPVRVTRRASITGAEPTTMKRRPPTVSARSKRRSPGAIRSVMTGGATGIHGERIMVSM
jgi:hypothetical protein